MLKRPQGTSDPSAAHVDRAPRRYVDSCSPCQERVTWVGGRGPCSILASMGATLSRATVSHLSGTGSLIVWIFAQSPYVKDSPSQLYTNYKTKSVEGLSPVFLLQWMLGDLTNLIGCLLTKQLFVQVLIAAYMLAVDLCLCSQYLGTCQDSCSLPQVDTRTSFASHGALAAPDCKAQKQREISKTVIFACNTLFALVPPSYTHRKRATEFGPCSVHRPLGRATLSRARTAETTSLWNSRSCVYAQ